MSKGVGLRKPYIVNMYPNLASNANLRRDPTRTTTLRASYAADLKRRMRQLQRLIIETVAENDALYLAAGNVPLINQAGTRFEFVTAPERTAAFLRWLESTMDELLLASYDPARQAIPNRFILRAMIQAAKRADSELVRAGIIPASSLAAGAIFSPGAIPLSLARTAQILFTRNYELLKGVTADISKTIARELSSGVLAGINPRQMARQMTNVVDKIGIVRSTIIARTEVVNAYAETTLDRYEQWGVQQVTPMVEFSSAGDDRVCEKCQGLEGTVRTTAEARGVIPVHPQCLPGNTLVATSSRITGATKRWYDGDLVIIRTARGKQLSCTPNHPILTDRGWVEAGSLDIGDNVVSDCRGDGMSFGDNYAQDMPARIEDIAEAFFTSGQVTTAEVEISPEHFHGDGIGSKVAIIGTDGFLLDGIDAALGKHLSKQFFLPANMQSSPLNSFGMFDLSVEGNLLPSSRKIGGFRQSLPLFRGQFKHADFISFTTPAQFNSLLSKSTLNDIPGNSEFSRQRQHRGAHLIGFNDFIDGEIVAPMNRGHANTDLYSSVFQPSPDSFVIDAELIGNISDRTTRVEFFDNVIDIKRKPVSCHVYNLETEQGYYSANGIITHNCRCTWLPIPLKEARQLR